MRIIRCDIRSARSARRAPKPECACVRARGRRAAGAARGSAAARGCCVLAVRAAPRAARPRGCVPSPLDSRVRARSASLTIHARTRDIERKEGYEHRDSGLCTTRQRQCSYIELSSREKAHITDNCPYAWAWRRRQRIGQVTVDASRTCSAAARVEEVHKATCGRCIGSRPKRFLQMRRCLENLSSGEKRAGCADSVGLPSGASFCATSKCAHKAER